MDRLVLSLLLCLSFWHYSTLALVLAIDYGTDWISVPYDTRFAVRRLVEQGFEAETSVFDGMEERE